MTAIEDFTWVLDSETNEITITYFEEDANRVWANRSEKTVTYTGALTEEGAVTVTSADNEVFKAEAELLLIENTVLAYYVSDRDYKTEDKSSTVSFGDPAGTIDGTSFEYEVSASDFKLYLKYSDGKYDIFKSYDSSNYILMNESGTKFIWTNIPVYIKDADITKENLYGTWTSDDGADTAEFTSSNYNSTWYIENFKLYVKMSTGSFSEFTFDFDETDKNVQISAIGQDALLHKHRRKHSESLQKQIILIPEEAAASSGFFSRLLIDHCFSSKMTTDNQIRSIYVQTYSAQGSQGLQRLPSGKPKLPGRKYRRL